MTIGADPTPGPAASDSFEQLVNLHERRAQYVARRLTGNSEDAKDAVQEGFLAAFLARDRFRNDAPFGPWLARIVANEAHERRKHTTRHLRLQRRAEQAFASASAEAADSMTLRLEDRRRLIVAVRRLAPAHREVVFCRFFLDLSEAETARILELPVGTVKSRLSRALDALRVKLELAETA